MEQEELEKWKTKKKCEAYEKREKDEMTADEYRISLEEIDMIN